jgi:hypothetical protein
MNASKNEPGSNNEPNGAQSAMFSRSGATESDALNQRAGPNTTTVAANVPGIPTTPNGGVTPAGEPDPAHPHDYARAMAAQAHTGAVHLRDDIESYAWAWAREKFGPIETEAAAKLGARQSDLADVETSLAKTRKDKRNEPETKPSGEPGVPWNPVRKWVVLTGVVGLILFLTGEIRQAATYVFATVLGVASLWAAAYWLMGAVAVAWAAKLFLGMVGAFWRRIIVGVCAAFMVANFLIWAWTASHALQSFGKEAGSDLGQLLLSGTPGGSPLDGGGQARWFFFCALVSIPLTAVVGMAALQREIDRHEPPKIPNPDRTRLEARENALRNDRTHLQEMIVPLAVGLRKCRGAAVRLAAESVTIFDLERSNPGASRGLFPERNGEPPGPPVVPPPGA